MKNKIIIVLGPTGSGKTELSIKLAKKFNGEIISADSRQIYKGMKIGTAQIAGLPLVDNAVSDEALDTTRAPTLSGHASSVLPEGQQRNPRFIGDSVLPTATAIIYKGIRHYLVGFLEPDQIFSVAEFKGAATEIAKDIIFRKKIPIICGGTAHYIQAITEDLDIPRVPPNWKLRRRLEKKDLKELVKQLKKLDPKALKIVDLKNKRRIIRALEVRQAGLKFSEVRKKTGKPISHIGHICLIGLKIPRKELYKRIDRRVEKMIKDGLVEETKNLRKKLKSRIYNLTSTSGIGYKEIIDHLAGKTTLEEASQLIKYRTHKYVRYQMGWFRKNKKIKWVKNYGEAERLIKNFLNEN